MYQRESRLMTRIIALFCFLFFLSLAKAQDVTRSDNNFANNPDVKTFINEMVMKHHFDATQLNKIFSSVKMRPSVIQNVKAPAEQKPWSTYRLMYVTEKHIAHGLTFWEANQDALAKAEEKYGVPASIIVATIGIESKYGKHTGDYRVIDALTNLAFGNTSRTAFFRQELEQFLLLTREQHLDPLTIMGSYAGAIGQPQFMPSSYRHYAVNFSGNTSIDLSHNEADVIGSIANYYNRNGWQTNQPVAAPVSMAGGEFLLSFSRPKPITLSELIKNQMIPNLSSLDDQKSRLIILQTYFGNEYWRLFHNFEVIKRYNHSDLYAMAVYQLSYYIALARGELNREKPH